MLKYKIPQIVTLTLDPINPPKSLIYSKKEENHY
jgi:hypothetical protein